MKLIVGLGNPGEKYEKTRHNLGFMTVDRLVQKCSSAPWENSVKVKSEITSLTMKTESGQEEKVFFAKPQTYMNNSGLAVSLLLSFYKISPEDLWVVYDELDLPLGSMKIRFGGAAAGHHGVESIIEKIGTDQFWRFRLGIGELVDEKASVISKQKMNNVDSHVLGVFSSHEQGKSRDVIAHGADALLLSLKNGIPEAQKKYNIK